MIPKHLMKTKFWRKLVGTSVTIQNYEVEKREKLRKDFDRSNKELIWKITEKISQNFWKNTCDKAFLREGNACFSFYKKLSFLVSTKFLTDCFQIY